MRAGSWFKVGAWDQVPEGCRGIGASRSFVIGLGILLGYVLLTAFSNVSLADLGMEPDSLKGPLALSGGAGVLVGCAVATSLRRHSCRVESLVCLTWALCVFTLLKRGCLIEGDGLACVLVGDILVWACVIPLLFVWCRASGVRTGSDVLRVLGYALVLAVVIFLVVVTIPAQAGVLATAVVLPAAFAFVALHNGVRVPASADLSITCPDSIGAARGTAVSDLLSPAIGASLGGAFFLLSFAAGFLTDLVPVSLNDEALVGFLNLPAAYMAVYLVVFSVYLLVLSHVKQLRFLYIYGIAVVLITVGYLSLPFSTIGGFALSVFAAGEVVAFTFIGVLLYEVCLRGGDGLALKGMLLVGAGMLAADILSVVVQLSPSYAYDDFSFRTAIAAVAAIVILVLALVLLPKTEEVLVDAPTTSLDSRVSENGSSAGTDPINGQLDCFVSHYGLTAREADIVALIASGRDVPYIERELDVAKSTVKTHIKHIYEKCGVSSRQALLDLLEVV